MKHEEEWCGGSQITGNIQNEGSWFAVDHSGIDREASGGFRRSSKSRGRKETRCRNSSKPAGYGRRPHCMSRRGNFEEIITQELSTRQSAGFVELQRGEARIKAAAADQLGVAAFGDDAALIHHNDAL